MTKQKQFSEELAKKYPNLYVDMFGDKRNTLLSYGISVGEGWFKIIEELSSELESLITKMKELGDKNPPKAAQVKEKFGSLCFYMSHTTQQINEIINKYTRKSYSTCEICGEPGENRIGLPWIKTLCEKHFIDELEKLSKDGFYEE
jgi:hypothetical protein